MLTALQNADKDNIRLLAGDINFGNSPVDMENNSQYECLKKNDSEKYKFYAGSLKRMARKFDTVKIINDMPEVKIKFYKPPKADLKIRGRLKH